MMFWKVSMNKSVVKKRSSIGVQWQIETAMHWSIRYLIGEKWTDEWIRRWQQQTKSTEREESREEERREEKEHQIIIIIIIIIVFFSSFIVQKRNRKGFFFSLSSSKSSSLFPSERNFSNDEPMTESLSTEFDKEYDHSNRNSFDGIDEETNPNPPLTVPSVVIEPTTTTPASIAVTRKDSIVIPSVSNGSISSVLQIENVNPDTTNPASLAVCTSNSLGSWKRKTFLLLIFEHRIDFRFVVGDISSTPLLLDNPTSNSPVLAANQTVSTTNSSDQSSTTFIECRSFRSNSSSSSRSSTSDQSPEVFHSQCLSFHSSHLFCVSLFRHQ